ncbi:MAG: hypothetical protein HRT87_07105 [Legionellales bacterium]|nr:hypothetical protein [Legionellales bacterium]
MKGYNNLKHIVLTTAFTLFTTNIYAEIPYNWDYLQVGENTYTNLKKSLSKHKIALNLLEGNDFWKEARISTKKNVFGDFDSFSLKFNSEDVLCEAIIKYSDRQGELFNYFKNNLDDSRATMKDKSGGNRKTYAYSFKNYTIEIDRLSSYEVKVKIINEKMFFAEVIKKHRRGQEIATDFVKNMGHLEAST